MLELDLRIPVTEFVVEVAVKSEGLVTAIVGASGAGKTSLLEAIAGLRPSALGRIRVDGETLLDSSTGRNVPPERRRIGYVPQDALLFPHLRVEQNLRFSAAAKHGDLRELVELLDLVPLLGRMPATLSGGEKQRVAIGRAIASRPRLLLLDEPLAAVEVERRVRVLPYLLRVKQQLRIPMLYVTHQWAEARVLADDAVVLERGRVVAHGRPDEVLDRADATMLPGAYDNVLRGRIVDVISDTATLEVEPHLRFVVPNSGELRAGDEATFVLPSDEVIVSLEPLPSVSARNVTPADVIELRDEPEAVMVRVALGDHQRMWARVTHASIAALSLKSGARVFIAAKTQALRNL